MPGVTHAAVAGGNCIAHRVLPVGAGSAALEVVHQAEARLTLKALALGADLLLDEPRERRVVLLSGVHGSPTPVDWQPVPDRATAKTETASPARIVRVIVSALRLREREAQWLPRCELTRLAASTET